jgi:hypothetical protein
LKSTGHDLSGRYRANIRAVKSKKPKRSSDPMELAKLVGDMAKGQTPHDDDSIKEAKRGEKVQPKPSVVPRSHP